MEKEVKVSIKQIINEYFRGLKGYRGLFVLSVFFFVISYVLNIIIPYFFKDFFNILSGEGIRSEMTNQLFHIVFIIGLFYFSDWIFYRAGFFMYNYLEASAMAKIKQNSFNYLIQHSHNFFTNNFTGSLVQKVNRQARAFERLFDTFIFQFVPLIISVTGALIITYFTSRPLALAIALWITIFLISGFVFYKWRMKYNLEMAKIDSETTALLSDNISNNQTISLFNGQQKEIDSYCQATNKQAKTTIKTWNYAGFYDSVLLFLTYLAEVIIFLLAVKYWATGALSVGGIVMIQIYVMSLGKQIWTINRVLRDVFESTADSKEMVEILQTPHEIQNKPLAVPLEKVQGEIKFQDVTFNFNETRTVLEKINCLIKPGEKVALVGPSGAGKTTFVRLILRLYNLTEGKILIDGQDISGVTQESLRQNISLVPQDPILFHRTLKENIRYGQPEATDEEVLKASHLAHCAEFIDALPFKYDTLVGERGIKLSGGERQRIAIARAILKNSPILILDEATSSLDSHSEALIQEALDNLMKGRTTLAIAHRLSTIRKMDRIIVFKDGQIIEDGTHDELANKDSGLYKDLWELQAGGFIEK
jgi:ATP-binding cassette subfamily B protein